MTHAILLIALASRLSAVVPDPRPNPVNRVLMTVKPAVVRVVGGVSARVQWRGQVYDLEAIGSGSGFFVDSRGYLATNAHVVEMVKDEDAAAAVLFREFAHQVLPRMGISPTDQSIESLRQQVQREPARDLAPMRRTNLVILQSGAQLPFEIKAYGAPVGEGTEILGKDVAILKVEMHHTPLIVLGNSEETQVGDRVFVIGYPGVAELRNLGLASGLELEPSMTGGSISARKMLRDGTPVLQTDAPIADGSSGGPVINEKGECIGIATFGSDQVEAQGFRFLVSSNTVAEFVRQAGADNKPGTVDLRWKDGLDHFWNQEYADAKDKFSEVTALFPEHSEARKLITQSQERIAAGKDRSGHTLKLVLFSGIVVALLGLLGIVIATLVFLVRKAAAPASADHVLPDEKKPTVLFTGSVSARLVGIEGPTRGAFPIGNGVFIGRDSSRSQLAVVDSQVSGQHAWVGPVEGRIVLRDLGSTNGTFINENRDRRIQEIDLRNGDIIVLGAAGGVKFRYEA